jgi:ADP-ribose pyrophosphatase YjhB (NUDIX family)
VTTALKREVFEETKLNITKFSIIDKDAQYVESILPDGQHYIVFFFIATEWTGILENVERDKCYGWIWIDKKDIFKKGETLDSIKKIYSLLKEIGHNFFD